MHEVLRLFFGGHWEDLDLIWRSNLSNVSLVGMKVILMVRGDSVYLGNDVEGVSTKQAHDGI